MHKLCTECSTAASNSLNGVDYCSSHFHKALTSELKKSVQPDVISYEEDELRKA